MIEAKDLDDGFLLDVEVKSGHELADDEKRAREIIAAAITVALERGLVCMPGEGKAKEWLACPDCGFTGHIQIRRTMDGSVMKSPTTVNNYQPGKIVAVDLEAPGCKPMEFEVRMRTKICALGDGRIEWRVLE